MIAVLIITALQLTDIDANLASAFCKSNPMSLDPKEYAHKYLEPLCPCRDSTARHSIVGFVEFFLPTEPRPFLDLEGS